MDVVGTADQIDKSYITANPPRITASIPLAIRRLHARLLPHSPSSFSALQICRSKSVPLPILFCSMISRLRSQTLMPVPSKAMRDGVRADLNL
jgi:hypothetical protein